MIMGPLHEQPPAAPAGEDEEDLGKEKEGKETGEEEETLCFSLI